MGNHLAVEASPGSWSCDSQNTPSAYPRKFKDFLHVWECVEEQDATLVQCNSIDIPSIQQFKPSSCYIVVHVQYNKVPSRSYDKISLRNSSDNANWQKTFRSFSALKKDSLKSPLISKGEIIVSSASPYHEIYVWMGKESSVITQSVAIAEAYQINTALKTNKSNAGTLRTLTTSEFIPIPFDTESLEPLLAQQKQYNKLIQSIIEQNTPVKKEVPSNVSNKRIPNLAQSSADGRRDKQKAFASLKSTRNVGIKSLSSLIPALKIPGGNTENYEKSESKQKQEKLRSYSNVCSRIEPNLYLAGESVASNRAILMENNITNVLNCAGTYCENYFPGDFVYNSLHLHDGKNEDISCFFLYVIEIVEGVLAQGGKLLFHCQQGVSRSAAFLIMYLMWSKREPFDVVFKRVKSIRGICNPNTGFIFQLLLWGKRLGLKDDPPLPWAMLISPHSSSDPESYVARNMEAKCKSFDSRGVFLIQDSDVIYKWIGSEAPERFLAPADEYIHRLQKYMNASRNVVVVKQGCEPEALCTLLGGSPAEAEPRKQFNQYLSFCSK